MKSSKQSVGSLAFLISFLLLAFLLPALILSSCAGKGTPNNQGGGPMVSASPSPSPSPTVDPLVLAKMTFKNKVWEPFFKNDRCVICHDFAARGPGVFAGHPVPNGNPATCTTCHTPGVVGFNNWVEAPDPTKWNALSDPDTVRSQIITLKGPNLFRHLLGEGVNADPFVQWCFFNAPVDPPDTTKPGFVPPPPNGTMMDVSKLMDYTAFTLAVKEWLCLEAKVPGSTPLTQAGDVIDCSVF